MSLEFVVLSYTGLTPQFNIDIGAEISHDLHTRKLVDSSFVRVEHDTMMNMS